MGIAYLISIVEHRLQEVIMKKKVSEIVAIAQLPKIFDKKMNAEEFQKFLKEDNHDIPIEQVEFSGAAVFGPDSWEQL